MISAIASAAKIVAPRTSRKALRRARRARMNWLRSMWGVLEKGFFDADDVVGSHRVLQLRIALDDLAVGGVATHLEAPVAAARRDAAAGREGLHHRHARLHAIRAGAGDLAVDVEH